MNAKKLSQSTGIPKRVVKNIEKAGLFEQKIAFGAPDESTVVAAAVDIMALGFTLDELQTMGKDKALISKTVKNHIALLREERPRLCEKLEQACLAEAGTLEQVHDGARKVIAQMTPERATLDALSERCAKLLADITMISKKYAPINFFDALAYIPLIGIPFSVARTVLLDKATPLRVKFTEEYEAFLEGLGKLELDFSYAAYMPPSSSKGRMYDTALSTGNRQLSPGHYINDILDAIEYQRESVWSIGKLLDKLKTFDAENDIPEQNSVKE